jgi:DNA-binding protein HU-beta
MNKKQLIEEIAKRAKLKKGEARQALDAVFQIITESLKKDEPVAIPGFGKFTVRKRKAMKGRNPSTGDPIDIPNTKLPSLSASRVLKKAFNS